MVWDFLEGKGGASRAVRFASVAYTLLTCALVFALFILDACDTTKVLRDDRPFKICEAITFAIFGVDYLLRLWSCVEDADVPHYGTLAGECRVRLRTMLRPIFIVDVLALFGLGFDIFGARSTRGLGILRVVRVLFVCHRLNRDFHFYGLVVDVVRRKRQELLSTLFIAVSLLVIAATLMNYLEEGPHSKIPDLFTAMWWATTALTTVGYGDVYPVTWQGRLLASITAFLGVGLFALPAGILASGFQEAFEENKQRLALISPKTAAKTRSSRKSLEQSRMSTVQSHNEQEEENRVRSLETRVSALLDEMATMREEQEALLALLEGQDTNEQ